MGQNLRHDIHNRRMKAIETNRHYKAKIELDDAELVKKAMRNYKKLNYWEKNFAKDMMAKAQNAYKEFSDSQHNILVRISDKLDKFAQSVKDAEAEKELATNSDK